jgi:hypothetical protein
MQNTTQIDGSFPDVEARLRADLYRAGEEDMGTNQVNLAIKLNNCDTTEPCALCHKETEAFVGPELFLADSYKVVCRDCGHRYAPILVSLLELAQAAINYDKDVTEHLSPGGP